MLLFFHQFFSTPHGKIITLWNELTVEKRNNWYETFWVIFVHCGRLTSDNKYSKDTKMSRHAKVNNHLLCRETRVIDNDRHLLVFVMRQSHRILYLLTITTGVWYIANNLVSQYKSKWLLYDKDNTTLNQKCRGIKGERK